MTVFSGGFRAPYRCRLLETATAFQAARAVWDALWQVGGGGNIALHHDWLSAYLAHFPPRSLCVALVEDADGALVAAAPWMIGQPVGVFGRLLKRLQFIGTAPEVYDWAGVLIHPQMDPAAVMALLSDLLITLDWDVADWRFLRDESQLEALNVGLRAVGVSTESSQPMCIPYLALPEDFAEYPARLRKKKYQADLNRIHNHLREDTGQSEPTLIVHAPGPAADAEIAHFLASHAQYWQARSSRSPFHRHPALLAFYRQIHHVFGSSAPGAAATDLARPIFEFSSLRLGDQTVSRHFDIHQATGCLGYLSLYDPAFRKYRPGMLHIEALIARTHRLGERIFAFGRGDEPYKSQWRIQKQPLWNLLAFRSPWRRFVWMLDERLKAWKRRFKPVSPEAALTGKPPTAPGCASTPGVSAHVPSC